MRWKSDLSAVRHQMITDQILQRGIRNPAILNAMEDIPRHQFVPFIAAKKAYRDAPIPIGLGQTISQPYITAYMTNLLDLDANHRVLEIGTGSGYQTALLAHIAKQVYTVEVIPHLFIRARKLLTRHKMNNIQHRLGNGREGWPEAAPFDRILVTAAGMSAPDDLLHQLAENGLMVMPIGDDVRSQRLEVYRKKKGKIAIQNDMAVRFVPLIDSPD